MNGLLLLRRARLWWAAIALTAAMLATGGLLLTSILAAEPPPPASPEPQESPGASVAGNESETEAAAPPAPASLGVRVAPSPGPGVLVLDVRPDGSAAESGLRFGDYILAVAGRTVHSPDELRDALKEHPAGTEIDLTSWRNGSSREHRITLRALAPEPPATLDVPHAAHRRAWLGLMLRDRGEGSTTGVEVGDIYPDGPADQAGLKPSDVIVAVGTEAIHKLDDLIQHFDRSEPGTRLELTVEREGKRQNLTLVAGDMESQPQQGGPSAPTFANPQAPEAFPGFPGMPPGNPWMPQGASDRNQEQLETLFRELLTEVRGLREDVRALKPDPPTPTP